MRLGMEKMGDFNSKPYSVLMMRLFDVAHADYQ